jgi:hypothetical protein
MDFWDSFWSILWWTLWIFIFVGFLFVVFRILYDVISDDTLGGWGKFFWVLFVLVMPIIGSLVYLLVRGPGMGERSLARAAGARAEQVEYVRGLMDDAQRS